MAHCATVQPWHINSYQVCFLMQFYRALQSAWCAIYYVLYSRMLMRNLKSIQHRLCILLSIYKLISFTMTNIVGCFHLLATIKKIRLLVLGNLFVLPLSKTVYLYQKKSFTYLRFPCMKNNSFFFLYQYKIKEL